MRGVLGQGFDRLAVGGQVQLAGRLEVLVLPGADFQAGAVFNIVTGAVVSGTFETVLMPRVNDAPLFEISCGTDYVRLTALRSAPPPPSLVIPLQTPSDVRTRGLRLQISHLLYGPLTVEFSTDLRQWQPLMTLPGEDGALEFLAPQATTSAMGFYRGMPKVRK